MRDDVAFAWPSDVADERRKRLLGRELHRRRIRDLDFVEDRGIDRLVDAAVRDLALEAVFDVFGGELAPVVPLDALAQFEDVGARIGLFVRLGQPGDDRAVRLRHHQLLVDLLEVVLRDHRRRKLRIESGGRLLVQGEP